MYGCHLAYGKVNKAVIELADSQPVDAPDSLLASAPSKMLPEYAAKFKPELGRTFATTVSRDAPPAADGTANYWVQPKDLGGLFPGNEPPEIFPMAAPRGAAPNAMHAVPNQLMTPAERREALVFEKCHMRARHALRKAANDACQLTRTMQMRHPHGVMGVEGPGSSESVIYAQNRDARLSKHAKWAEGAARRYENIAMKRDSQLDYKLMTHDPKSTAEDHMFPRKAKSTLGPRGDPTSEVDPMGTFVMRPAGAKVPENAFRSNQEKPLRQPSMDRSMSLLNTATRGKGYDIISGVALPIQPGVPANVESAGAWDRRAHPSNLSMPHSGVGMGPANRGGTAPTLIGPIPDAHASLWKPTSPSKSPSKQFMR